MLETVHNIATDKSREKQMYPWGPLAYYSANPHYYTTQGSETRNDAAYSELSQFIHKKIPSHDTGQVNLNNPSLKLSF